MRAYLFCAYRAEPCCGQRTADIPAPKRNKRRNKEGISGSCPYPFHNYTYRCLKVESVFLNASIIRFTTTLCFTLTNFYIVHGYITILATATCFLLNCSQRRFQQTFLRSRPPLLSASYWTVHECPFNERFYGLDRHCSLLLTELMRLPFQQQMFRRSIPPLLLWSVPRTFLWSVSPLLSASY